MQSLVSSWKGPLLLVERGLTEESLFCHHQSWRSWSRQRLFFSQRGMTSWFYQKRKDFLPHCLPPSRVNPSLIDFYFLPNSFSLYCRWFIWDRERCYEAFLCRNKPPASQLANCCFLFAFNLLTVSTSLPFLPLPCPDPVIPSHLEGNITARS